MRIAELKEESTYILYVNGKPATKYKDDWEAITMLKHLKSKFPDKKYSVEKEVCSTDKIAEDSKSAEEIKIPGASGWYGIENTDEGVILYGEDVEIEGEPGERPTGWIDFKVNIDTGKNEITYDHTDTNSGQPLSDYMSSNELDEIINEIVVEFKYRYGSTWDEINDELHGGMEIDRD